jgi:hypothetical protein
MFESAFAGDTYQRYLSSIVLPTHTYIASSAPFYTSFHAEKKEYDMLFWHIPASSEDARSLARDISSAIRKKEKNIVLLHVFEPFSWDGQLSFTRLKSGEYLPYLEELFATLRHTYLIWESDLGILVPYPEINTPAFDRTGFSPRDFGPLVNDFFRTARISYPNARGSLLLDAKSYDGNTWNGEQRSLSPYLKNINPSYIESFWLQGFPWVSPDGKTKIYNPIKYLPLPILEEAALTLWVKKVWLNTGTLSKKYKNNPIPVSTAERKRMLDLTVILARRLKSMGYDPMVHIFAEEKYHLHPEGNDWSYSTKQDKTILSNFQTTLKKAEIEYGTFDPVKK